MPTYDAIGLLVATEGASVTTNVVPSPYAYGTLVGNSLGTSSGMAKLNAARGKLGTLSGSELALSWIRGMGGELICRSGGAVDVVTKIINVTCSTGATLTLGATVKADHKGVLLSDVALMVHALWGTDGLGIQDLRTIKIGRARIVQWCNTAMQLIYSRAERLEYFNRDRITVTVPDTGAAEIPATVQRVMGNAAIGTRSLRPLGSKAEVDTFATLYGGTVPIGFLVESTQVSNAPDSLRKTLYLAPAPAESAEVILDVTLNPPRWDESDLLAGALIPLPHKWAETLFLPLVRKWAAGDSRMPGTLRAEQIKEIDDQYEAARRVLGLANVSPETTQKGGEEEP